MPLGSSEQLNGQGIPRAYVKSLKHGKLSTVRSNICAYLQDIPFNLMLAVSTLLFYSHKPTRRISFTDIRRILKEGTFVTCSTLITYGSGSSFLTAILPHILYFYILLTCQLIPSALILTLR